MNLFFFFKQKTAYEMRISDWSSDVCSSDLDAAPARLDLGEHILAALDDRLVKGARALHFLEDHRRDDMIVEESGTAIGDLVLQRDPQMPGDRPGRRDMTPVREHRFLHPAQIMGVVHMSR